LRTIKEFGLTDDDTEHWRKLNKTNDNYIDKNIILAGSINQYNREEQNFRRSIYNKSHPANIAEVIEKKMRST
jgi:hypothetical protein